MSTQFEQLLQEAQALCLTTCRAALCIKRGECCSAGHVYGLSLRAALQTVARRHGVKLDEVIAAHDAAHPVRVA